jgi:hypothetical protein
MLSIARAARIRTRRDERVNMRTEVDELTDRISKLSDDELVKMLAVDHAEYQNEALEIGRREFSARNLGSLEERARALRDRPAIDVSRLPSRPGVTWPGFVIAGIVFVLEVVEGFVSADAQSTLQVAAVFLAILGFFVWLDCVGRLHRVLARVTNGKYPISPVRAAGIHFVPFFNVYWLFRWSSEVMKFVNRRDPSRTLSTGWPGVLLLVGFLARFLDASLALLVWFGVVTMLNRRVVRACAVDATSDEPIWSSTAITR